jgi:hypothetical protein
MAQTPTKIASNRFIVIGAAIMIVLYLAFGHAMASDFPPATDRVPVAMLTIPPSDVAPTGAPMVLDSTYKGLDLRK